MIKQNIKAGRLVLVAAILMGTLLAACQTPATVCHATGDPSAPYQFLNVDAAQLQVHMGHPDDIIPAPAGGCPASAIVPVGTGTAASDKITICHKTGSKTNPYVLITVDVNGLNGHDKHPGDIIPAPAGGCPTTSP